MKRGTNSETLFRRILVAVDGSESSMSASKVAIDLARSNSASLVILNVLYTPLYGVSYTPSSIPPSYLTDLRENEEKEAHQLIEKVKSMASQQGVTARGEVLEDIPSVVQAITDYAAKERIDLIVIGTRGLSGFKKLLLGSVSGGVATHATCSVLIVR